MNSTPARVVYLVIIILGTIACVGMTSLCLTLFFKNYADPIVFTAINSITSASISSVGTLLASTRSQPPSGITTATVTTTSAPQGPDTPTPVVVINEPENPVPVETQP